MTEPTGLGAQGVGADFAEPIRAAITGCVDWMPAIDADPELRDGAQITELTHLVDLSAYPEGTRMIVRRERPHPGAQLSLFDTIEGLRHQVFITDSPRSMCSVQLLELRHRSHARVEDRIRCDKDSGIGRFPSRQFAINAAWLELALIGIDLLAFTRTLLLDGEHAPTEPKKLRFRLLHVAARLVRTARGTILRIARHWPWANQLATAYARLAALPQPVNDAPCTVYKGHGEVGTQPTLRHAHHPRSERGMPPQIKTSSQPAYRMTGLVTLSGQ
jgi:hypothetical protein